MTIKDLKKAISMLDDDANFVISSDEELNNLFKDWEISLLHHSPFDNKTYVIFGYSPSLLT